MPVNEILAPYYAIFKYRTPSAAHSLRCYFETGSVLEAGPVGSPNNWTIQGVSSLVKVSMTQIATALFSKALNSLPANTRLNEIQLWQSQPGSNVFLHNNELPATVTFGSGAGVAASYSMPVYAAANRQKFRLTYFDGAFVSPQTEASPQPPLVDDNSLNWYILRGPAPFATQDGYRLLTVRSFNTGYNRKLARAYGRSVTP